MKKSTQRITLVALVAATVMSVASAQEDFQQGPPPGGPRFQGGPQGGPGMGPRGPQGGPAILMIPPVREELKLTEDQMEKLQEVLPRPEPGQRISREDMERAEKGIQSVLSKEQFKRYREISLQMGGPGAMIRPEIAKELGLSEAQVKQIQKVLEANRPQGGPGGPGGQGRRGQGGPGGPPPGGGFGGPGQGGPGGPGGQGGPGGPPPGGGFGDPGQGGPGGPPPGGGFGGPGQGGPGGQGGFGPGGRGQGGPGGPGMGLRRKELEEKVMAILTDAQKAKWKDMLGKPFQPKPPRRDRDDN